LVERALADQLKPRLPARQALRLPAHEGVVAPAERGGYTVALSGQDLAEAAPVPVTEKTLARRYDLMPGQLTQLLAWPAPAQW
ncbi:GntR family transcriptional regulator, partial [Streptomyces sp. NPDC006356]